MITIDQFGDFITGEVLKIDNQDDYYAYLQIVNSIEPDPDLSTGNNTSEADLWLLGLSLPRKGDLSKKTNNQVVYTPPPRRDPPPSRTLDQVMQKLVYHKGVGINVPDRNRNITDDTKWQSYSAGTLYHRKMWLSKAVEDWYSLIDSRIWGMLDNTSDPTKGRIEIQKLDYTWVEIMDESQLGNPIRAIKFTQAHDPEWADPATLPGLCSAFWGKMNLRGFNPNGYYPWDRSKSWQPKAFKASWSNQTGDVFVYGKCAQPYPWDILGDYTVPRESGEEIPFQLGDWMYGNPSYNSLDSIVIECTGSNGFVINSVEMLGKDPAEFYAIGHEKPLQYSILGFNGGTGTLIPGPDYTQYWPANNPWIFYFGFDTIIDWDNTNGPLMYTLTSTTTYADWDGRPPYTTTEEYGYRVMTSISNTVIGISGIFRVWGKEFASDAAYTRELAQHTFDYSFIPA